MELKERGDVGTRTLKNVEYFVTKCFFILCILCSRAPKVDEVSSVTNEVMEFYFYYYCDTVFRFLYSFENRFENILVWEF